MRKCNDSHIFDRFQVQQSQRLIQDTANGQHQLHATMDSGHQMLAIVLQNAHQRSVFDSSIEQKKNTHIQNANSPVVNAETAHQTAQIRADQMRCNGGRLRIAQSAAHNVWEVEHIVEHQLPLFLRTETSNWLRKYVRIWVALTILTTHLLFEQRPIRLRCRLDIFATSQTLLVHIDQMLDPRRIVHNKRGAPTGTAARRQRQRHRTGVFHFQQVNGDSSASERTIQLVECHGRWIVGLGRSDSVLVLRHQFHVLLADPERREEITRLAQQAEIKAQKHTSNTHPPP